MINFQYVLYTDLQVIIYHCPQTGPRLKNPIAGHKNQNNVLSFCSLSENSAEANTVKCLKPSMWWTTRSAWSRPWSPSRRRRSNVRSKSWRTWGVAPTSSHCKEWSKTLFQEHLLSFLNMSTTQILNSFTR